MNLASQRCFRGGAKSSGRCSFLGQAALFVSLSAVPFAVVALCQGAFYFVVSPPTYLVFHNLAELFSVIVSLSIFALGWSSYSQNNDKHALFLSAGFLATGLIDCFHALGYSGMPDLVTPNLPNKATLFWLAARLVGATVFLASAWIYPGDKRSWINRATLLGTALILMGGTFVGVIFYPEHLPEAYRPGFGLTPFKVGTEYLVIGVLLWATLAYWRRWQKSSDRLLLYYLAALILCIYCELAFTLYRSAFDSYNMLGHLYKVIAYLLIYRGVFVAAVRRPYQRLRQSRRILNQIVDSLPQSIFWKDRNSVYLGCNRVFASRAGLASPVEIFGKNDFDLPWSREESEGYRADDRVVMEQRLAKEHIIETQRQAGGDLIWVDTTKVPLCAEDGAVEGVVGVYEDITERKQAEQALRESNDRFFSAFHNAPIAMAISTLKDGVCIDANQRYLEVTGVSREEIVGKTFIEAGLITPSERQKIVDAMQCERRVYNLDLTYRTREGKELSWIYSGQMIQLDGNDYLLSSAVDLTQQRLLEQQLRQSQKMEALGQLAGGVAHDFNNILQVIVGYAALLDLRAGPEQKPMVQEIAKAAERAAELTNGLLSYSRKQVLKLETADLNQVVRNIEKFLIRILGEDIQLTIHTDQPVRTVIDKAHIQQVFVNLASNARDAMPHGGRLSISVECIQIDEQFVAAHNFGQSGPYALIRVSDTGEGIPAEYLQHIFEPFFTTKVDGKGTGLGLAIVYGIVNQHHGSITCYSEPGIGTTFNIYLPLTDADAAVSQRSADAVRAPDRKLNILMVEDDEGVRKVTRKLLETFGHQVVEAENGRAAVDRYAQDPSGVDLVLLDALMPGLNGGETLVLLKEVDPAVKVLFMSGYAREVISGKMVLPENFEFVAKPVVPAALIEAIGRVVG